MKYKYLVRRLSYDISSVGGVYEGEVTDYVLEKELFQKLYPIIIHSSKNGVRKRVWCKIIRAQNNRILDVVLRYQVSRKQTQRSQIH